MLSDILFLMGFKLTRRIKAAQCILGGTLEMTESTERPCKLCGALLVFAESQQGKEVVLDAEPYTAWYLKEGVAMPFLALRPHKCLIKKKGE
jgi:hypothetical protein